MNDGENEATPSLASEPWIRAIADRVELPDENVAEQARTHQNLLTKPPGSLGRLEDLAVWWCSVTGTCAAPPPQNARVVVFAGDHGVVQSAQTSAFPAEVTPQMVLNFLSGGAAVNALAREVGATVRVVDIAVDVDWAAAGLSVPASLTTHKVRRSSNPLDLVDALSDDEVRRAFQAGVAIADEEIDSGADLLIAGDMGIGNTTPAAAVIGSLTHTNPAAVVGRGTGIDDDTWMRKTAAVRDGMYRARSRRGDPLGVIAAVGGADLAAMTGFLLNASARRVPVILDGMVVGAAALAANTIAYRARNWWLAGHRSVEPAHQEVLNRLRLEPVVDFSMRLGEGSGALVALGVLRAASATMSEMATFDTAGVSQAVTPTHEDAAGGT